jgi:hypothetical protein
MDGAVRIVSFGRGSKGTFFWTPAGMLEDGVSFMWIFVLLEGICPTMRRRLTAGMNSSPPGRATAELQFLFLRGDYFVQRFISQKSVWVWEG